MDEHQHTETNPTTSLFQMNLDAQNSYNLRSAASWAKVLGVVGIILGIIFCIMSAVRLSELNSYRSYNDNGFDLFGGSGNTARTGLWMLILTGFIFILGGVFSYNFGNRIGASLRSNDQEGLNRGFAALRNYYAVRSITLIIVLLLFLLSIAGSV